MGGTSLRGRIVGALTTLSLVGTALVLQAATPADASTVTVPYSCTVNLGLFGTEQADIPLQVTTNAPSGVETGTNFTSTFQTPAETLPGGDVSAYRNFKLRIPIPANSAYVTSSLSGGFNLGSGTPTIGLVGGQIEVSIPGPIAAEQLFQFPQISVTLTATGPVTAPPTKIEPRLGTLTLEVHITTFSLGWRPVDCPVPSSNPALASVNIVPEDLTPPMVTINTPANGASYPEGAAVPASYACDDGPQGTGVASCVGTVANGALIDTSSPGAYSFTVTSFDVKGNGPTVVTHNYNVVSLPGVSAEPVSAFEDEGPLEFEIRLSRAWSSSITVDYDTLDGTAVQGVDYTNTTGSHTFTPGQVSHTVSVPIVDDAVFTGNRELALSLDVASGAVVTTPEVSGKILDDDAPEVKVTPGAVEEGPGAFVRFKVELAGEPNVPVTVAYVTADGSAVAPDDYTTTVGSLDFGPDLPLSQLVDVPVVDDGVEEDLIEEFDFTATGPANSTTVKGSIIDNTVAVTDTAAGLSIAPVTVVEGNGPKKRTKAVLTATLPQVANDFDLLFFETVNGTAVGTEDFRARTVKRRVKPGATSVIVPVQVVGDTLVEDDEYFYVRLTAAPAGTPVAVAKVNIIDDDPAPAGSNLSMGDVSIHEADNTLAAHTAVVTVTLSQPPPVITLFDVWTEDDTAVEWVDYRPLVRQVKVRPTRNSFQVKLRVLPNQLAEADRSFKVRIALATGQSGVNIVDDTATVTILDNDTLPGQVDSVVVTPSATEVDGADVSWGAPADDPDFPVVGYQYRLSTDGGSTFGPWGSTGTGLGTTMTGVSCGDSCDVEVRALNARRVGDAVSGSGSGRQDGEAPDLSLLRPISGSNRGLGGPTTFSGQRGVDVGDQASVDVAVYPCRCTNVAPVSQLEAHVVGGAWSATESDPLPAGVYTAVATQTDKAGNTATSTSIFQVRNALFVDPLGGNDANPGTHDAPKQTLPAAMAAAAAITEDRPDIVAGIGTYDAGTGLDLVGGVTVRGGFNQYRGWARPDTLDDANTPNERLSEIQGNGQGAVADGDTGVVLESVLIRGRNTGLPAGSSVYGLRAVNGADLDLQNVAVEADAGVAGIDGANGSAGGGGGNGGNGGNGNESCNSQGLGFVFTNGGTAGAGARAGGRGGHGVCGTNGQNGIQGQLLSPGLGGTGGTGGTPSANIFCGNGDPGFGGAGGAGGSSGGAGGSPGAPTPLSGAGAAYVNAGNGSGGGAGDAGHGGGGGGAGGGQSVDWTCAGRDWGGGGGGGGAGGAGGAAGAGGGAGGGSFGLYVFNATVIVDADTSISAASGGVGGDGGNGGPGGNGGNGGRGGSVGNSSEGNNPLGAPDGGPGASGSGGGGGQGGGGGGGGAGGPSVSVFHRGTGSVTGYDTGELTAGGGGAGGTGGVGSTGGSPGVRGPVALGSWSTAPRQGNDGAPGGAGSIGTSGAGGPTCRVWSGSSCALS
jgi:hypothetical protein